jgi:hypothetical protein
MKKKNFLNGLTAKLALAFVALASTVLTSCEKENFNVAFEASNAKVIITPTVIDLATNTNVTSQATISGNETIEGNKAIAAGSATVTATLNGVTGSVTVDYPAVEAGQVVSLSPVILLSAEYDFITSYDDAAAASNVKPYGDPIVKYGTDASTKAVTHGGIAYVVENNSDYFVDFTASWSETANATLLSTTVAAIEDSFKPFEVTNAGEETFTASAWSAYNAQYTIQAYQLTYDVVAKAANAKAGTLTILNPIYSIVATPIEVASSHANGHYVAGHGHDNHGESNNAGGGIVLAE